MGVVSETFEWPQVDSYPMEFIVKIQMLPEIYEDSDGTHPGPDLWLKMHVFDCSSDS